jgi:hypothetical protein
VKSRFSARLVLSSALALLVDMGATLAVDRLVSRPSLAVTHSLTSVAYNAPLPIRRGRIRHDHPLIEVTL